MIPDTMASTAKLPRIANSSSQRFVAGRVVYMCMYGTDGVYFNVYPNLVLGTSFVNLLLFVNDWHEPTSEDINQPHAFTLLNKCCLSHS